MRRFDAIFIDFYGTITGGDRIAVESTCARIVRTLGLAMSPDRLAVAWGERFFRTIDRSNDGAFRTLHECEVVSLQETLEALDERHRVAAFDTADFVTELEAYWRDPPIHPDAVDFLRTIDLPVVCVSNADTEPLEAAIDRHGLTFDAVVSSEQARSYKPHARIFHRAAEALGVDLRRVAHIGDSLHSDIAGAAPLGITTVWLRRDDRIHDIGSAHPDHTESTLTGILELFR